MKKKTIRELLKFRNDFTFYDHYNIERVMELNYVRDYMINILAEDELINENQCIPVLGVIGVIYC